MLRKNVLVDETTQAKLEPETLEEVVSVLWPRDCQSCGRSLGDEPCALLVNDMISLASASLHHPRCSEPKWNDGTLRMRRGALLSWAATPFATSFGSGDRPEYITGMVLNPTLEMVHLERRDDKWQLRILTSFRDLGFEPPGDRITIGVPVRRSWLTLTPTSIAVAVGGAPDTYEAPADPNVIGWARKRKGILLMATHSVDPHALNRDAMNSVLSSRHTVLGWVPLYGGQES